MTRMRPQTADPQVKPAFHMAVWAELARIMMTAHQRRGESDDVAHWMYQLMALDPGAVPGAAHLLPVCTPFCHLLGSPQC